MAAVAWLAKYVMNNNLPQSGTTKVSKKYMSTGDIPNL